MLTIYRQLLRLYPASYRQEFAEEMLAVFQDARSDNVNKKLLVRTIFQIREIAGLVGGALEERLRVAIGPDFAFSFPPRSFIMRNGFRFPKSTAVLMALILGGVVLAIKRGEDIAASLPHVNPQTGPIQPVHSTLLPPIVQFVLFFYAAGLVGWAILFALKKSGVHRLAQMPGGQK
ncbi:MAG TPA: hypothetical protein VGS27_21015 [Candidatus Sulfotelmatobacter sp.]|nr:hypothetical protein [Candidatus Sulfotelmatobacter sp.]